MADNDAGNNRRDTVKISLGASLPARLLRQLADYFDAGLQTAHFRASLKEINFLTLLITSTGILTIGGVIHGSGALIWLLLFAALFNAGILLIFSSSTWLLRKRTFLAALVALSAIPTAAERLLPMLVVVLLSCYFVLLLTKQWELPHSYLNVLLVLLYCYVSYGIFAATLEWRRNSALVTKDGIAIDCTWQVERALVCSGGSTSFDVPEFWRPATALHLIADLAAIMDLQSLADSATDNRIAFAVFSSPPAAVMRSLTDYFNAQKKYLSSKGQHGNVLVPQRIMKSRDAELYALSYRSPERPGYLGTFVDRNALLLLHQPELSQSEGRDTTWLFVIDGTDLAAREFLLHRIITGFRRSQ